MRPAPVLVAFVAFGVVWGAWQAVLPDLAGHYALSSGPLGGILTLGFAVSLPAMLATGRLLDRVGAAWVIGAPAIAMAAALAVMGGLPPFPLLIAAVIVFASGSGAYDVAINAAAMGDAAWSRPARLTLLHAAFSGGGMTGAVAAGAVVGTGTSFRLVYAGVAAALVLAGVIAACASWSAATSDGSVPRRLAFAMLPLAGLAALAFVAEGSMETWSAIYLRDELGAAAFVGALGPGAFHAAMLVGRLIGAGFAGRLGAAATLLVAGAMGVAGMVVALVVPLPVVAIPGMALAALGASFVVPVVVSLAAVRSGAGSGQAASYVLTLGYAGFLVGPSVVGVLGEVAGLRTALAVVPLAALVIAAGSRTGTVRTGGAPTGGGGERR